MSLRVYNEDALMELLRDDGGSSVAGSPARHTGSVAGSRSPKLSGRRGLQISSGALTLGGAMTMSPATSPTPAAQQEKKELRFQQYWEMQKKRSDEVFKKTAERLQWTKMEAERKLQADLAALTKGGELVAQMDRMLELQQEKELQKSAQMYSTWQRQVYFPVQDAIIDQLDKIDPRELNERKCGAYQGYLDAANSKNGGGLYLDTIVESDYNPLATRQEHTLRTYVAVRDPLKRILTKDREEKTLLAGGARMHSRARQREVLDIRVWHEGKIQATPHGHFADFVAVKAENVHDALAREMQKSSVQQDHFNVRVGHLSSFGEQLPGKRMYPESSSSNSGNRTGLPG
jgi:hypothetical protein|tara:strand:- start:221 stop:1258 length:1038 start_codon:yes stop_codon:yes gene_type:complete